MNRQCLEWAVRAICDYNARLPAPPGIRSGIIMYFPHILTVATAAALATPAPPVSRLMIVTIGPPCAGKTTFCRRGIAGKIVDVAIDDHPETYYRVPWRQFARLDAVPPAQDTELYGSTLSDRLGRGASTGEFTTNHKQRPPTQPTPVQSRALECRCQATWR